MLAPAFALLLTSAPAATQPDTMAAAAEQALTQVCLKHSPGIRPLVAGDAAMLSGAGIEVGARGVPAWVTEAPPEWGAATVARIASTEGPVWVAAYDKVPVCSIFLESGARHAANNLSLRRLVEAPRNAWKKVSERSAGTDMMTLSFETPSKPSGTLRVTYSATTDAAPRGAELIIISTFQVD